MNAIITNRAEKFNANDRKENHYKYEFDVMAVMDDYSIHTPVILRIYGTDARSYCAIWTHGNNVWKSGTGNAGGYGYHRPSAAACEAIYNAGFDLDADISGRGDSVMKEACLAIARAIEPNAITYHIHEANP